MKFVVKTKDGRGLFSTEYESCVPVEKLDSMSSAGLTFWIDGKKTSLSATKIRFKDVKPLVHYGYEDTPVKESDITIHMYNDKEKDSYPIEVISSVVNGSNTTSTQEVKVDNKIVVSEDKEDSKSEEVNVDGFEIDFKNLGFTINSRCIVCLNNGKVYRTQSEAGKELKLDPASISTAISNNKPYKGYTFKKALEFVK